MFRFLEFSRPAWVTNRAQLIGHYYLHRFGLPFGDRGVARIETPFGSKLSVPLSDHDSFLQVCGTFASTNPWNELQPDVEPRTIVDLGANRGYTGLYWKARYPNARVFCVEMDQANATACAQLLEQNHYEITVSRVAIAAADGSVTYRTHQENMRHRLEHLAQLDDKFVYDATTSTVPAMTLSSYLDLMKLETVDLMKVDIEGAEQYLLDSISDWASRVTLMAMEIHHNIDRDSAKRILEQAGFEVQVGDQARRTEWWCRRRS